VAAKKKYSTIDEKIAFTEVGRREAHRLRAVSRNERPRDREVPAVHIGPMAISAMLRKDEELFQSLQKVLRKIIAIDMEAAAIGVVAHTNRMPYIVAKAFVDYANLEKSDQFRYYASLVSATFLIDLFMERGPALHLFPENRV
jgi:nucleoside phosphorylase